MMRFLIKISVLKLEYDLYKIGMNDLAVMNVIS